MIVANISTLAAGRFSRRTAPCLQLYQFCALRREPAAQIVGQRRINPVSASTQDFDFTARRQREDAVRTVRGSKPRFDSGASHNRKCAPVVAILEFINRKSRNNESRKR